VESREVEEISTIDLVGSIWSQVRRVSTTGMISGIWLVGLNSVGLSGNIISKRTSLLIVFFSQQSLNITDNSVKFIKPTLLLPTIELH